MAGDQLYVDKVSNSALIAGKTQDTDKAESFSPEYLEQNPYPGLNYYDENREEYFFGRDKEKHDILQILELHSLCFIIGKSGMGKSSLINAGLIPALKKRSFVPIKIRINFDAETETDLTQQVKAIIVEEIKKVDSNAISFEDRLLWEYFHDLKILRGYLKPVLIFDQFEEIFTRGRQRKAELNNLLTELIDLAENRVPEKVQEKYKENKETIPSNFNKDYRIIFCMREDYLPQLTGLRKYIPTLKYSLYRLDQMDGLEAFNAVYKPSLKAGFLEKTTAWLIVDKIPESKDNEFDFSRIEDVESYPKIPESEKQDISKKNKNKKVEPFLLNLLCYTLNEERKARRGTEFQKMISETDVLKKNFSLVIKDYYEKITKQKFGLSLAIEKELVTPDGKYRKFSQKHDFEQAGQIKLIRIGKLNEADIEYLINSKLIRRKRINDLDYFELIHDVLIPIVVDKRKIRKRNQSLLYSGFILSILFFGLLFLSNFYKNKIEKENEAKLNFANQQVQAAQQKAALDSAKKQIQDAEQKSALNSAKQQIRDAQHKAALDSANQQFQAVQQKAELDLATQQFQAAQQKAALALATQEIENEKEKAALDSANNEAEISNLNAIYSSKTLAKASKESYYLPAKKTIAFLAYDTLPKFTKLNIDDKLFMPEIYESLINAQNDMLRNDTFYVSYFTNSYMNMDGVFNSNNTYYFSRPFKSVNGINGFEIKEPALIHSWIDKSGQLIAMELLNTGLTKSLVIKDFKNQPKHTPIILQHDEEIVSLIFGTNNETCVYTTKLPGKEGKVCKLKINSTDAPSNLEVLRKNEYMFLAHKGTKGFIAVSNIGQLKSWEDFAATKSSPGIDLKTNQNMISSICYIDASKSLFVGYENGQLYRFDSANNFLKFIENSNARIISMAGSRDGKFLATGYFRGGLVLWRLDSKPSPGSNIVKINLSTAESFSSLCFSEKSDSLVAVTNLGAIYNFPMKVSSLIDQICKEKKYLKPNEWKIYIRDINYRKICD